MKKILLLIVAIILFSGCARIYRGYEGLPLNESEIAVLEHPNPMHSKFILEDIDGSFRGFGLIERYELLPGEHSISCTYHHPIFTSGKITIYFKAEANKVYVAQAGDKNRKWMMRIIEKDTQKVVSYTKGESDSGIIYNP